MSDKKKNAKKNNNTNIKCNVDTCVHNNQDDKCCNLDSISVSCTCKNDACTCTEETVCQSFKTTSGKITDNEYEVDSEDEDTSDDDEDI